ncbi:unnamed protein product [Clavelina lepadiformis]|uniref:Protein-PII uridylyltransferase N-terminal domain-containing protein n=1 Tax=Clavelina lepadiformis TaxID=159417 RepID=A0ABP0FTV2_CLALP
MEDLNAEEDELAKILRNELCYPNGIEKNPKECAVIFHKLGLLYKRRYNIEPDKIFLIQSAALMNAALVRKPDNTKTVQNDIQELYVYVLRQANVQTKNNNHLDMVTERVKTEVNEMREWVDNELFLLRIIPDNAKGDELLRLEKEKISKIMMIQEKTTASYRAIMKNLDRGCLDVLRKVPCKYTLAGMGSLSRNEITPYSDFENIIVLEEGAQDRKDYEEVLEYFRWFAVIFQLVLINIGETILPSVAIPSLNNFTIKGGDWFFDAYTTRGISFDGLMPQACKSPLGRQRKTEAKPFTTELIKPVSLMLAYLESSRDVYDDFESRLDRILEYKV